jgi:hypothetical protein
MCAETGECTTCRTGAGETMLQSAEIYQAPIRQQEVTWRHVRTALTATAFTPWKAQDHARAKSPTSRSRQRNGGLLVAWLASAVGV